MSPQSLCRLYFLESGGVAPLPPGLGACKSHKSTIGLAKVIQAPEVARVDASGRKIFFIFGEGGPARPQAHPARQPYQSIIYGRMCQGNNLTYPQLFLFDSDA